MCGRVFKLQIHELEHPLVLSAEYVRKNKIIHKIGCFLSIKKWDLQNLFTKS